MDRNIYKESNGMKDVTTSVLVKMPQQESGNVPRGQKNIFFLSKLILFYSEQLYDILIEI